MRHAAQITMPDTSGLLVPVGTHRLFVRCAGTGAPSVVFDAALGASSLSWTLVQPAVAQVTRTCAYDRAGFGRSEAGPLSRTASRIAGELELLLAAADIPPPWVLVGHSYGGLVLRLLAARHRDKVAGMVLIEPATPEDWIQPNDDMRALIARGTRLCRYGTIAARSRVAVLVAALVRLGALAPARALVALVSRGGLRRQDEEILAPIWKLPPEARAQLPQAWTQPRFFQALGSQIETISESARQVLDEDIPGFDDLPLTVITAESAHPHRLKTDAALARRSQRGRHVLVPDSGHWVPLDAPQVVIDAVLAMVHELRREHRGAARPDTHMDDRTRR
jgi:pimeloyl-ACP methyl ester carboxylesterase